jgi:1-acyl-sn-glycerol-3-phosphate acyltransferase
MKKMIDTQWQGAYEVGGAATRKEEEQEQQAAAAARNGMMMMMMKQALVFHDGRLVRMPTEVACAFMCLWLPVGAVLAVARISVWVLLPVRLGRPLLALLGVRLRVQGSPPPDGGGGVVYVCSHRSVMDGMALSLAVGRKTAVAIYSVSRVVELLIPMPAVRLARRRAHDAAAQRAARRAGGGLTVCPEGTTCREPFLLRFSPLFAELGAGAVVPVGLRLRESLFHGSSARGLKMLDPFFFFLNPAPAYVVNILAPLEPSLLPPSRAPLEVANHVQALLARLMGYRCTQLTRRHKYRFLAGNDGNIDPITASSLSSSSSASSLPPSASAASASASSSSSSS